MAGRREGNEARRRKAGRQRGKKAQGGKARSETCKPHRNNKGEIEGIFFFAADVTEQVLSRKKIEESEKRFRRIVETAREGIWVIDENNKTTLVNKKMGEMIGYSVDEIMEKAIQDFMDEEERKNSYEQIERRKKGESEDHELRFITKSGKPLWTNISTNPIVDNEGKHKGALAMITDITHRRESEMKLLEQREQLQKANEQLIAILDALPPHIALLNNQGTIFAVNDAWKKIGKENGMEEDYVWIGKNYIQTSENEKGENGYYANKIAKNIKNVISGKSRQFSIGYPCHSYLSKKWFRAVVSPLMNKINEGAVVLHIDITERKLAEEKLEEKQEQLLASQKMAHIGSWHRNIVTAGDIKPNPVFCSEETLLIMGLPPDLEDMTYEKFLSVTHPEDIDLVKKESQKIFNKISSYYKIEHRIILPDGTVKWVSRDAKLINDKVTGPVKVIGTIQDINIRKEQQLPIQKNFEEREILITRLTNSIKDLKQFTFITSHNFKSPLSNLTALLDLFDYSTLTDDNRDIIEMFRGSTIQLNKTINDLIRILVIKNNVNVHISNNDISELLDEACIALQPEITETACTINRKLEAENIHFNKSYLQSILMNLLGNALKFRSLNRPLHIDISTKYKPNGEVVMTIKDNGSGIDLCRHQNKIFGLYQKFHSNAGGAGLGLFIVKSQITALGGDISVESEVDKGTSFVITFRKKLL